MPDFTIRADSVDVEQIMRQIRARIREKRGVDYTEQEIEALAAARLERFLDPQKVRSDLLTHFGKAQHETAPVPNYAFEDTTLFESHRAPLRWIRRLLRPVLKLFFNPNPLIQALHIQGQLNARHAREADRQAALAYEVIHNLVVELTRVSIEVRNLKMRVEALASRLDFDERRARALEGVVQYRPGDAAAAAPPPEAPAEANAGEDEGTPAAQRSRRRRRKRGRKGRRPTEAGGAGTAEDAASPDDAEDAEGDTGGDADEPAAGAAPAPTPGPDEDLEPGH